jgi:hypothetical protein
VSIGVATLLAGVLVYWLSTRDVDARLALLTAVALTVGFVGLTAQYGSQGLAFSLADDRGVDPVGLAKTLDGDAAALVAAKVLAFGGLLLGILLAVGTLLLSPPSPASKAAALGLLAVPFAAIVPALDPALSSALLAVGAAVAWSGFAMSRFRPDST